MERKQSIRKEVFQMRKEITDEAVALLSDTIFRMLIASPEYKSSDRIYVYVDTGHEVSTRSFILQCFKDHKQVAAPRVDKATNTMAFYEITSLDDLQPGYFGIYEPTGETPCDWPEAMLLIPGVAFDKQLHRVGYGGGFYDRYLEGHPHHKTVALAFDFQVYDEVPFEANDISPAKLLTPSVVYLPGNNEVRAAQTREETVRQYAYMDKCRSLIKEREAALGRPLTFCVTTFGCQMNARDSEKLEGILETVGYTKLEDETKADFVIFNTCTVRENANLRVYGRLGQLGRAKKNNPELKIALCGCMMQEKTVVDKIKKSYRFVDLIFGTHNLYAFAELLYRMLTSGKMVVDTLDDTRTIVEELPVDRKYPFKSGVNIMFGCNNFCSYCIVPYVRGREKSREPEDIITEIKRLVADGVVEVMLLGQNVNSYGKNLERPISFASLLTRVCAIEGLQRVRFMTSHPKDLSDELIQVMKENPVICSHIHLPLQSGSSAILKRMNRRYTKEQYLALVDRIRQELPEISITTDIIVGFPGETEVDFLETMDVVSRVGFDSAFTFIYSRRTGTPAAAMKEQIPEAVVKDRFDRLLKLVQTTSAAACARFTGTDQVALAESVNEQDPSLLTGRMSNNLLVHFPGDASEIGRLIPVHLDTCRGFYYMGSRLS